MVFDSNFDPTPSKTTLLINDSDAINHIKKFIQKWFKKNAMTAMNEDGLAMVTMTDKATSYACEKCPFPPK